MKLLIDIFTEQIFKLYGVTENHARFLFERWSVESKFNDSNLQAFLESEQVKKVFFIKPDINVVKHYSKAELDKLGITLSEVDAEKHKYSDSKYQLQWEEIYHGMSDSWTGLYKVISSSAQDEHLLA